MKIEEQLKKGIHFLKLMLEEDSVPLEEEVRDFIYEVEGPWED